MSVRRELSSRAARSAACVLVLSAPVATLQPCQRKEECKPIVDVRFDSTYRQIQASVGDEWAPTWGRDNVLYTANNDGTSFGDIPSNAIAFGKLEGSGPYDLKGTTISGMQEFRERPERGPEGASWNTLESYEINGVLYRFVPCGLDSGLFVYSCLRASGDGGKSWKAVGNRGKPLFVRMKFSSPFFISFRKEYKDQFGGKPGDYVYAASYAGMRGGEDNYVVGRVPTEKLPDGNAADWSFEQSDGSWGGLDKANQTPNSTGIGPDGANWKAMNSYSVDGVLYMFVTRCHYPWLSGDPKGRHSFRNASIIKSTDKGQIWTRSAAENYSKPMFPGMRFGAPYFVWYGQDGKAGVDNADKYVYAVSNNGHFEGGDDYVLGRVLKTKLPQLSAADWSFYMTGDGMLDGSWTPRLDEAAPILRNPGRSSMTGMTYIAGLSRYVMVVWHYSKVVGFATALQNKDLSTVLEFFEAPKPWGPWISVKSFDTGRLGWYTPIIGQRFQKIENSTTVRGVLYATGLAAKPEGGLDAALYKLDYMPITLSTKPLQDNDPAFVAGR